jgi:hypothetical protein
MVSHATGLREEFLGTRPGEIVLSFWLSLIHLNGMEPQAQKSSDCPAGCQGRRSGCSGLGAGTGRLSASMVSLTFVFQFPHCSHSQWTIERHHFEAEYGESLETIDYDLVVIHGRLDGLFAAVVRWTVCVFVRVSLSGPHHGIPSLIDGRCCGLEPKRMLPVWQAI